METGLKLFGVQIDLREAAAEEVIRKCYSTGNLTSFAAATTDHGYLSDAGPGQNSRSRARQQQERKRGVPWTEEEHRAFLAGLERLGKGDWRGISRSFVKTRTPTQVASHAQKYFLRQSNQNKKRRSSLFDAVVINDNVAPSNSETPIELSSSSSKRVDAAECQSKNNHLARFYSNPSTSAANQDIFVLLFHQPADSPSVNHRALPLQSLVRYRGYRLRPQLAQSG